MSEKREKIVQQSIRRKAVDETKYKKGQIISFKFPPKPKASDVKHYQERKISLIDKKTFVSNKKPVFSDNHFGNIKAM